MDINNNYIQALRIIKKYAEISEFKAEEEIIANNKPKFKILEENIQLASLAKNNKSKGELDYILANNSKYRYIQGLLNGAISLNDSKNETDFDQVNNVNQNIHIEKGLYDFITKDLNLLWAAYTFINSHSVSEGDEETFYLLGPISKSIGVYPSFTFPMMVNSKNLRGQYEFHKVDDEWMNFYVNLNTLSRSNTKFINDFPRYFESSSIVNDTFRRNNDVEHKNNLLYISSGEIDHSILQWLVQEFIRSSNVENASVADIFDIFSIPFHINIDDLSREYPQALSYIKEITSNAFDKSTASLSESDMKWRTVFRLDKTTSTEVVFLNSEKVLNIDTAKDCSLNGLFLKEWLQKFGYLSKSKLPTERLMASLEFFYYHLLEQRKLYLCSRSEKEFVLWIEDKESKEFQINKNFESNKSLNYFSLNKNRNSPYYLIKNEKDLEAVDCYVSLCKEVLPVHKSYEEIRSGFSTFQDYDDKLSELINSYIKLLIHFSFDFTNPKVKKFKRDSEEFRIHARLNVFSHFFQRCIDHFYDPFHREQSCRGLLAFPVFSNPVTTDPIKNLGYFMGLIKDSDDRGRCYFNWRTHSKGSPNSETIAEFYDDTLFYLQNFAYTLAQNEIKQVYYKGIKSKDRKIIKEKALLNALSTVLNRNGSHNLGSHVLSILSSEDLVKKFLDKDRDKDASQNDKSIIYNPVYYKHINWYGKDSEKQSVESLVAYFNAYLKNRLDLLAAVGTSGETVMLNNKLFFQALFKNFERNQILLEHISGKGDDFLYRFNLTLNDKPAGQINEKGKFEINKDIEVAIPNDLLGDQALYLLLENIIRNTAKHGNYVSDKEVVFTINLCDCHKEENFYIIEVSDDNCLEERFRDEKKSRKDDKKFKGITDIIKETNARIDKDILQDDFNIREGGWGTIEMKIACCYLSGLPLRNIDNDAYRTDTVNNKLPIIEAFDKEVKVDEITKNHLAYRFYIQKPKSVLVVDIDSQLNEKERKAKSLTEKGITILNTDELETAFTKRTIYKHQFMVAFAKAETDVSSELKEWYENKQLPNRVLKISENRKAIDFKIEESSINENLLDVCYRKILKKVEPTRTKDDSSVNNKYLININEKFDLYYHIFPANKFKNAKQPPEGRAPGIAYQYEAMFTHHSTAKPKDKVIYCEPYGSTSSLGLLLKVENIQSNLNKVYHILYDAVSTHILVIDERIQNGMGKIFKPDSGKGDIVSFEEIYKDTGVIVPNKDKVNLNKPKEETKGVRNYIFNILKENQIDYFILHFGILEKIVNNASKEGFKEFLTECRKIQKESSLKIVLTSGRGIPSDLPDDEYFCNFSSIDYYLSDTNGRSKAHLVQLLKNQRIK